MDVWTGRAPSPEMGAGDLMHGGNRHKQGAIHRTCGKHNAQPR